MFLVVLIGAAGAVTGAGRAQSASAADTVKATFVQRFASFVSWPDGAFATSDAPMQICVLGSAPFSAVVRSTAREQSVGGRPIVVRDLEDPAAARSCHVLYATGASADEALRAVQGFPVLTVTDGASRSSGRGIIHFVVVDNRVRFHIDDAQAAHNKLTISSRLLSLALSVRGREDE
ncbi:MAG TPA: YfiR family protein [Caulobacterales bacterium]|nr:YfiR family protein [Caulobacterales bacterium]